MMTGWASSSPSLPGALRKWAGACRPWASDDHVLCPGPVPGRHRSWAPWPTATAGAPLSSCRWASFAAANVGFLAGLFCHRLHRRARRGGRARRPGSIRPPWASWPTSRPKRSARAGSASSWPATAPALSWGRSWAGFSTTGWGMPRPFIASALMAVLAFVAAAILVPETRTPALRKREELWKRRETRQGHRAR